jgi:hypothetical protein
MKTNKELLKKESTIETWGSRYCFESWVPVRPVKDIRNGHIYQPGDLIFALISYIDETNKVQYVNELQYLKLAEE